MSIVGVDQKGNRMQLKITFKRHRMIEVWLLVGFENGKLYQLPSKNFVGISPSIQNGATYSLQFSLEILENLQFKTPRTDLFGDGYCIVMSCPRSPRHCDLQQCRSVVDRWWTKAPNVRADAKVADFIQWHTQVMAVVQYFFKCKMSMFALSTQLMI